MARTLAAEVRSVLASQHHELVRLMAGVQGSPPESRKRALKRFLRFLALHEAAEAECLHNPAKEVLGEDARMVDARLEEEALAGQAIAVLEDLADAADSSEFATRFDDLCRALMEHADAEEHDEIPTLTGVLGEDDLARALAALSLVPELAPVHAHSRMPYEQLLASAHHYFRVAARAQDRMTTHAEVADRA